MFYFDPMYFVFIAPALLLGLFAQARLRGTFSRYARVPTSTGVNGQTAAQILMQQSQLRIGVRSTPGSLSDFYNPGAKTGCKAGARRSGSHPRSVGGSSRPDGAVLPLARQRHAPPRLAPLTHAARRDRCSRATFVARSIPRRTTFRRLHYAVDIRINA